jgi:hypothetical protein
LSKVDDDVKRRGEGTDEAELVLAGQKVTGSLVSKICKKASKISKWLVILCQYTASHVAST